MGHTPGPWKMVAAYGGKVEPVYWDIRQSKGEFRGFVASISDAENIDGITKDERDANARLISAAPDLLDALKDAARVLDWGEPAPKPVLDRVISAIAKAEGQP